MTMAIPSARFKDRMHGYAQQALSGASPPSEAAIAAAA
jgi:hypothetical protein